MDDSGRDHEEDIFALIRSSQNQEERDELDDGSQYLNDSGEGVEQEQRNEGQIENTGQLTKSSEVCIYIRPLVIIRCIN
jgi:hypothetical protein